jgi:hypothetical protein
MRISALVALSCLLIGFTQQSSGDTITLPDGSTMDGVVKEINANCVALTVGENTMEFQRTEIKSFEKNEKRGDPSKPLVLPSVQKWQEKLNEDTGLTMEQRDRVVAMVDALYKAKEADERQRAENDLIALNKTFNAAKFIKASLDGRSTMGRRMENLDALTVLEPSTAISYIEKGLVNPYPGMRVLCIRLYTTVLHKQSEKIDRGALTYLARGLIDFDPDVQFAAGTALAKYGDKPVTPVLLAKLDDADTRIRNIANDALVKIWEVNNVATPPEERKAFWHNYWTTNGSKVKDPLDPAKLQPLADKDVPVIDVHH